MEDFDRPLAPFSVAFGAEGYFLDLAVDAVRKWKNRSVTMLDASEGLDEQELTHLLQTPDYEGHPRTVIVDNAHKFKESKDKLLREYIKNKTPNDTSAILFAVVRSDKLPELWKVALAKVPDHTRRSVQKEYPKLKTYATQNQVLDFIKDTAKKLNITLEHKVDEVLYELTGGGLHRIVSELRKLKTFIGDGPQVVTVKHLSLVTAHSYNVEPYMVADLVLKRDRIGAMKSLSRLYKCAGDDPAVGLVYSLMRQVQKYIVARALLDKGASPVEVAAAIEMHPWACEKFFIPVVKMHDQKTLASHMSRLCKLELDVKGSSASKRTLVELAVLSIAQ
jgi:DNA polymerase III delta subunit